MMAIANYARAPPCASTSARVHQINSHEGEPTMAKKLSPKMAKAIKQLDQIPDRQLHAAFVDT